LHHAVQLPVEPGRAQGRAGDRRGLPVRAEAFREDAGRRADHRRRAGGNRLAERRVLDPALRHRGRRPVRRGRTPETAVVHRRPGWLATQGARGPQESRAGTGRQRRIVAATKKLKAGDPKNPDTFLGPMIDEAAAKRLEGWIVEAKKAGAKIL